MQTPCIDLLLIDSYHRSTCTDEGLLNVGIQRCGRAALKKDLFALLSYVNQSLVFSFEVAHKPVSIL